MIAWFLTSRVGQALSGALAIAVAVGFALLKAFSAGRERERAKQAGRSLDNVKQKVESDEAVDRLSDDAARRRLREWSRD